MKVPLNTIPVSIVFAAGLGVGLTIALLPNKSPKPVEKSATDLLIENKKLMTDLANKCKGQRVWSASLLNEKFNLSVECSEYVGKGGSF